MGSDRFLAPAARPQPGDQPSDCDPVPQPKSLAKPPYPWGATGRPTPEIAREAKHSAFCDRPAEGECPAFCPGPQRGRPGHRRVDCATRLRDGTRGTGWLATTSVWQLYHKRLFAGLRNPHWSEVPFHSHGRLSATVQRHGPGGPSAHAWEPDHASLLDQAFPGQSLSAGAGRIRAGNNPVTGVRHAGTVPGHVHGLSRVNFRVHGHRGTVREIGSDVLSRFGKSIRCKWPVNWFRRRLSCSRLVSSHSGGRERVRWLFSPGGHN